MLHGLLEEQAKIRKLVVKFKKNHDKIMKRRKDFTFKNREGIVVHKGIYYRKNSYLRTQYFNPHSSGQDYTIRIHRRISALEQARRFILNLPSSIDYVKLDMLFPLISEYIPYICDTESEWFVWTLFYPREYEHSLSQSHIAACFKNRKSIPHVNRQAIHTWYTRHYLKIPLLSQV